MVPVETETVFVADTRNRGQVREQRVFYVDFAQLNAQTPATSTASSSRRPRSPEPRRSDSPPRPSGWRTDTRGDPRDPRPSRSREDLARDAWYQEERRRAQYDPRYRERDWPGEPPRRDDYTGRGRDHSRR
jgi:hypothetical protein